MQLKLDRYDASFATLFLVTDDAGALRALDFSEHESRLHRLLQIHYGTYSLTNGPAPRAITRALDAYFQGDMNALADLPIATGGTPFQRDVWNALRSIPAGTTITYGQLAQSVDRPAASRAVGAANGANPISIVVPCHRVIGSTGRLTGYAGGLAHKQWLLDHELRHASLVTR